MAAAAVILAAVGIGFALWSLPAPINERANKVDHPTVAADAPIQNSEASVSSRGKPEVVQKPNVRRRPAASRTRLQPDNAGTGTVADSAVTEVTTDFMPIGYVNSASLQDGGSVVRVELPRSTIVSMGFALNMDRSGERVKADVLRVQMGLARLFVSSNSALS